MSHHWQLVNQERTASADVPRIWRPVCGAPNTYIKAPITAEQAPVTCERCITLLAERVEQRLTWAVDWGPFK